MPTGVIILNTIQKKIRSNWNETAERAALRARNGTWGFIMPVSTFHTFQFSKIKRVLF